MSPEKINVAIVGLGFGAEFIPIFQRHPDAHRYAICQRTREKLDAIGDAFGVQTRYSDYQRFHIDTLSTISKPKEPADSSDKQP